jgi:thioredoxin reductase
MHDVIVIGGGTAGLSAALVLGRARRRTLVLDGGPPRNAPSPAAHGVFTRDGTPPAELLRVARGQLAPYPSVELRGLGARSARGTADGFSLRLADGSEVRARRLLLAVGVRDELPPIEGLAALWGRGALHCPYCHGWEVRDEPLAVLAHGELAMELVPLLLQWSRDVVLCTHGPAGLEPADQAALARNGVAVIETPIARLEGWEGLERIVFADGRVEARRGLFLKPPQAVASDLPAALGCAMTETGHIAVGPDYQTSVPGVYAAGDAASPFQQVILAAAAGALAAIRLNRDLALADFGAAAAGG